ncbi:hypothetical protein SISNIDRAFT_229920 [Sistotremastrum niveocremeum HHB9708]|uniref:Uncharacterized protein n=2 Tax=Sistotremastraceae TaxID=3402574 RepID=A0A164Q6Q4_9AGAM|nr:hypothetical protein SISNIDRAFT_229920 [Sistotremastrum niveocremeum HHB9708]KZT37122.1 hypothetical protein SISSUDRAFT_883866 [Sistotremastrum suecicum HHB10207 ss-3]
MNSVFGGRNILGHEEVNKLTASQQPQPPSSNPLSNTSSQQSQQNPSQSQTSANQPPAGQGQQNYAPPVPYYYNPYYGQPNPYYGQPNPGYGLTQPFMKYPPMYQAGPPAPGPGTPSATPAKGPNTGAPPPGPNSYGTHAANHLYGQQHHVGGYDDGAYGHQQQQHHPQHQHQQQHQSALSGSQTGDYGKPPLYGLSHNQNFLGQNPVSQAALGRGVGQVNQPGANSPETPYKHYGGPSVGAVVNDKTGGVGGASQTHTQPGRGGVQQNAGTGYYGAGNRFPSSSGGGPQQAQGPPGQQGQGYPQGNETPYYYRGQQYWQ